VPRASSSPRSAASRAAGDAAGRSAGGRPPVLRVGELVGGLNGLLEEAVGRVWVAGEISGLRRPPSGHVYFSLKDDRAQIRVALFRSAAARVPFALEDGLEVVAYADVQVYAARGDLQLIARKLEPLGRGALQLAFEQLRERLAAEGLFDEARKRPLPPFPRRVGVVTSPTGAAIRDVIQVSGQRAPATPLLVAPTRVQGEGAEHEIAAALAAVAAQPEVDVVLVVRGGGSLEDLWSFNTEAVVRAIAACPVPVLSGVGHETDVTLADLVADARAPTPSAAALQALPDRRTLAAALARDWRRLGYVMRHGLERRRHALTRERDALRMLAPAARLATQRRRLATAQRALAGAIALRRERSRTRLARLVAQLDGLSPLAVLGRGYAIVQRERDGRVVRTPGDVRDGEALHIRLGQGAIAARVTGGADGAAE